MAGWDGEHKHSMQEMAAKLRVVLMGSEEAGSGENSCGGQSFHVGHGVRALWRRVERGREPRE
jgi:hypothetical protein